VANKFRSVLACAATKKNLSSPAWPTRPILFLAPRPRLTRPIPARPSIPASPKASLIFGPWANTEFYLQADSVFTRTTGAAQRNRWNRFRRLSLPRSDPAEISPWPNKKAGKSARALWPSPSAKHTFALVSPQQFRTDAGWRHGGTLASEQSSNRYGIEWANYYTPTEHLAFDADIADSRAQFTQLDPFDAAWWVQNLPLTATATTTTTPTPVTTTYYSGSGCSSTAPSTPTPGCVYVNWQQQGRGQACARSG